DHERYPADVKCLGFLYLYVGRYPRNNASRNTFREDDCRIRRENAPANFNTFRQFAINLIKQAQTGLSVKGCRFKAAWNDSFRSKILANL
ncbi:MAG: hypothetical protein BECKG1743E_GA0114224_105091, partial [Candidatus Kentron sp. G]